MEGGTAGEGNSSPSKTDDKKRRHVKDDPDAKGAVNDEPPAKKVKARTKKEPIIKNEDADGGSENEGPVIKKAKPRTKKEPRIENEVAKIKSENEGPANKETKAAVKKGKKADDDEAGPDFQQDTQPVKKGRKQAKKAMTRDDTASDIKDESSDHDILPPPMVKEKRAPRKATTTKKIKDEDTETDSLDPASELQTPLGNVKLGHTSDLESEASEDAPKLQKDRKRAPKKAVKRPAEKAKKVVNSKVRMLFASVSDGSRADDICRQFRLPQEPIEGRLARTQADPVYSTTIPRILLTSVSSSKKVIF